MIILARSLLIWLPFEWYKPSLTPGAPGTAGAAWAPAADLPLVPLMQMLWSWGRYRMGRGGSVALLEWKQTSWTIWRRRRRRWIPQRWIPRMEQARAELTIFFSFEKRLRLAVEKASLEGTVIRSKRGICTLRPFSQLYSECNKRRRQRNGADKSCAGGWQDSQAVFCCDIIMRRCSNGFSLCSWDIGVASRQQPAPKTWSPELMCNAGGVQDSSNF